MRWDRDYKNPEVINDPTVIPAYGVTDEERAYWNRKQDPLEYDPVPTPYSDKHMISGAIYNALESYKVTTVQACQDFYWTIAGGLEQTRQIATDAAETAVAARDSASNSASDALISKNQAGASETNAAGYAQSALASKGDAAQSAASAQQNVYDAEAWAKGTRNGTPVDSSDPAYHNNAEWYANLGVNIIDDDNVSGETTWSSSKLDPLIKECGYDIDIEIDSNDGYSATITLLDKEEYTLGSVYIPLPFTGLYKGCAYDNDTKILTFTDIDGNTEDVSIAALIIGLVPESRKIAGLSLTADITAAALRTALNVADGATNTPVIDSIIDGDTRAVSSNAVHDGLALKSDATHNHDDRYYTESEIDTKFNGVTFTTVDNVDYINW